MTSDQIASIIDERCNKEGQSVEDIQISALLEIAYHLALMNERMDREDEKFFGGLPSEREKKKVQTPKSRNEGTKQV